VSRLALYKNHLLELSDSAPLAQLDHLKAALTNAVDFIFVD
jgi:hypothetical protein